MPKISIDFKAGLPLEGEWDRVLLGRYWPKSIERLERLGGRLTITLTVPFKMKERGVKSPVFDENEMLHLREIGSNKVELQERLETYDVKNLRLACEQLGIAVSKKIPRVELIAEVARSLNQEVMWKGIAERQLSKSED